MKIVLTAYVPCKGLRHSWVHRPHFENQTMRSYKAEQGRQRTLHPPVQYRTASFDFRTPLSEYPNPLYATSPMLPPSLFLSLCRPLPLSVKLEVTKICYAEVLFSPVSVHQALILFCFHLAWNWPQKLLNPGAISNNQSINQSIDQD